MQSAQASEASLSTAMGTDFNSRFGEQSDIISGINRALSPTLAGGASQHGFSAEELAAKNTAAINNTGAANANAQRAISGELSGRGGDSGLMSGVDAQLKAGIASKSANNLANDQLNITNADFATGRDQYNRSVAAEVSGENSLIRLTDPTALGNEATGANKNSFAEASENNKATNQKWADIGGLVASATSVIPKGISGLKGMFGPGNLSDEDN
jgi:hypothetical protein